MRAKININTISPFIIAAIVVFMLFIENAQGVSEWPDGTLLRTRGYVEVFVIKNRKAHLIPSPEIFNSYNYKWNNIIEVDYLIPHNHGVTRLIKTLDNDKVYYLNDFDRKLWIPSPAVLLAAGYISSDITIINKMEMEYYKPLKLAMSDQKGAQTVFVITPHGYKRAIKSPEIFESYGYSWGEIKIIPRNILDALPSSSLIRARGDYKVYKIEDGMKRWITTIDAFQRNGFQWENVEEITSVDFNSYPMGAPIY